MKNNLLKHLCIVVALCLLPVMALALELGEPLTNECCYPEGSDASTATYVYRYSLPQIAGDSEVAATINAVYAYEAEYIETFTLAVNGDMYGVGDTQYYTDLKAEVTCMNESFLSVKLVSSEMTGDVPYDKVAAHVFALTGPKAGTVISLPYLLGALDMDENDEWLISRQTNKCDECVRGMVWEILQEQAEGGTIELYDDVDREFFGGCFYPEEDFYLNEDGDLVFFLQEDSVSPASYGVLTYVFSVEDLLDEL